MRHTMQPFVLFAASFFCILQYHLTHGTCGNGIIDGLFEGCDDGNLNNGDGCTSSCRHETPCGVVNDAGPIYRVNVARAPVSRQYYWQGIHQLAIFTKNDLPSLQTWCATNVGPLWETPFDGSQVAADFLGSPHFMGLDPCDHAQPFAEVTTGGTAGIFTSCWRGTGLGTATLTLLLL